MQTFNLSPLSNDELDKFASKVLELKRISFKHVKKVFKQMDEKYPFVMPNWPLITILILGTIVIVIIVSTIWHFK